MPKSFTPSYGRACGLFWVDSRVVLMVRVAMVETIVATGLGDLTWVCLYRDHAVQFFKFEV
jgi:hypothetical protein